MEDDLANAPPIPDVTEVPCDSVGDCDAVVCDAGADTHRASLGGNTESVSVTVVATVAAVAETDPIELPQLNSVVDRGAGDSGRGGGLDGSQSETRVSFTFDGHSVTVDNSGVIAVRPSEAGSSS